MTRPHPFRRSAAVALLAGVIALAAAACGSDAEPSAAPSTTTPTAGGPGPTGAATPVALPAAVADLDVVGTEYHFDLSATAADGQAIDLDEGEALPAGWTHVTFHNEGSEAHQVMFARLKDGVDLAELADTAGGDSSGSAAIEFVDMLGGVSYIDPGHSIEALVDLPAGLVLAMCYVPDANGVAHAMQGMTASLTVADGPGDRGGGEDGPPVQGTIEMTADGYRLPDPLPAGWYHVVNHDADHGAPGTGLHELSLLGLGHDLAPAQLDALLADLAANEDPAVPLVALGGMGALSAGFDGYLLCELDPGPHLAVDFMPDPGQPRPHLLDGYATPFEA